MRRLIGILIVMVLLIGALVAPAAAEAPGHWAAGQASRLAKELGWAPPSDLNQAIHPGGWNGLVALLAGVEPGEVSFQADERRYWVWTYTGGMALGKVTIAREDAIGGLMKLTYLLHKEKSFFDDLAHLKTFADRDQVADHQRTLLAGAVSTGIVSGYPDGLVRPQQSLTYGEAAALAVRFMDRYGRLGHSGQVPKPEPHRPEQLTTPLGFGGGLPKPGFAVDGVINKGAGVGTAGATGLVIHGAAYSSALPDVGAPPAGHLWVLVDAEVFRLGQDLITPDALRFTLGDHLQVLYEYGQDRQAAMGLGSPFAVSSLAPGQGRSVRGMAVFAVPVGTKDLWLQLESKLGAAKEKGTFTSEQRSRLGDLHGPERVYPFGAGRHDSRVRRQGTYERLEKAAAVVAEARSREIPAWVEAESAGHYAAIVGFRYFEE